jgi:hypothetical protein
MEATTPPRTARSLADLGALYGRNHAERRTTEAQRRLADGDLPAYSDTGPYIPCALCGANLKFSLAVARVICAEPIYAGYTHAVGTCDPKAVAAHAAKVAAAADANAAMDEMRRKRAGNTRHGR